MKLPAINIGFEFFMASKSVFYIIWVKLVLIMVLKCQYRHLFRLDAFVKMETYEKLLYFARNHHT